MVDYAEEPGNIRRLISQYLFASACPCSLDSGVTKPVAEVIQACEVAAAIKPGNAKGKSLRTFQV